MIPWDTGVRYNRITEPIGSIARFVQIHRGFIMKRLFVASCVILFTGLNVAVAQEQAEFATPAASPEHAVLKHDIGQWDAAIKMWIPGAGDEAMESGGTETNFMVGDFWIVNQFEYEAMGQKFSGHGVYGYDAEAKKYVGTWYSSDSPVAIPMQGDWDATTKTMTMTMDGVDGMGNPIKGKTVSTYPDARHKTFEMHLDMGDGTLHKMMEVKYTKK
jgi:hypothetical protein